MTDAAPPTEEKKKVFPLLDPNTCKDLKETYDTCFYKWYGEKFLKGQITRDPCKDEFDEYKVCLDVCKVVLLSVDA